MYFIRTISSRHRFLLDTNKFGDFLRRNCPCEHHSVTNVTFTLKYNKTTIYSVKRHLTNKGSRLKPTNSYQNLYNNLKYTHFDGFRRLCTKGDLGQTPLNVDHDYMECSNEETRLELKDDMLITYDFISEEEESQLMNEIEPYLKRLKYESSHWDDAIHGYRETERKTWTEKNKVIIQRVRDVAFPPGTPQLAYVHVLDLKKEGYIKPHVDAVKFCGNTVAGICLMSPAIMRLVHNDDKTKYADFLLERRCLYIMKDTARYNYTHEVLKEEDSTFKGQTIAKDRRISVICRNEPSV